MHDQAKHYTDMQVLAEKVSQYAGQPVALVLAGMCMCMYNIAKFSWGLYLFL